MKKKNPKKLLSHLPLRGHLNRDKAADLLLQFINFTNLQHHRAGTAPESIRQIEEENRQILDIFLNGILERSEQKAVLKPSFAPGARRTDTGN